MNRVQAAKLKTLITRHVNAQIALSWAGGSHPDDRAAIEHNARVAKANMAAYIRELQAPATGCVTLVSK